MSVLVQNGVAMHLSPAHQEPRRRQLGVTEHPPEHLLLVALDFVDAAGGGGADSDAYSAAVERLRQVVKAELEGQLADESLETGELGYGKTEDNSLLITVGFSTGGYDALEVAPDARPRDLATIPPDVLDSEGQNRGPHLPGEGSILLKICADDIYIVEHVLHRVEHELADVFAVVWVQTGVQRYNTRQARATRRETRALIGFLDGTSNLDPKLPEHRQLIFTDHNQTGYPPLPSGDPQYGATFPDLRHPPDGPEPARLDGGTYLAVEVMVQRTPDFDAQPVAEQEHIIGRTKKTGGPAGNAVVASHVLKANPARGEDDARRRVLRRGYSLLRSDGARLARGLILLAFGRTLSTQAEFIRRAWINNENFPTANAGKDLLMSRYVDPQLVCGGYYFVPPLAHASQPWSWVV